MRDRHSRFLWLARALTQPGLLRDETSWRTDIDALIELAEFHRVAGQLASSFREAGLPVPAALEQLRQRAAIRHLQMLQALRRAGDALDRVGVAWLVVKGPALTGRWYHDAAAREYHDLDLLVGPASLVAAIDALGDVGFAERNRNWSGFRAVGMGEVPLSDGDVTVDLHWSLVNFARERLRLRLATARLLERRVTVELGSVTASTLSDEDTLAHVVLHTAMAGARLLVHLRDVHVVGSGVDWGPALRRLEELRLDPMAAVVVDRAERTLGPIDGGDLARALGNRPWRLLNAGVDGLWGRAAPGAFNALPSFLVAATRPSMGETAWQLQAHVADSVRRRLGFRTLASSGGVLDWDVDAGGAAERARFLAEVEQGAFGD